MPEATVEVQGLAVRYAELSALSDVTVSFSPGVTVVVGPNGSGKSSLLKAIAGIVPHASGSIRIDDQPAAEARAQGRVAYVPQADVLDSDFPLTVQDVVAMGTYAQSTSRVHTRATVAEALAQVGVSPLAHRQFGELSGGERRRVLVARALAQHADVILLDEPTAGVDNSAQQTLADVFRALAARGVTVIEATHDLHGYASRADAAVVLHRSVIASGDPSAVLTPEVLARTFGVEA